MTSSQMLKGVLEGCVLALIGRGETYGYELVGALAACGLPGIAEGTLYPLLMRLEKKGLIASTYRESEVGPRRKYYRITDAGTAEIAAFADEFAKLSKVVGNVLDSVLSVAHESRMGSVLTGTFDAAGIQEETGETHV